MAIQDWLTNLQFVIRWLHVIFGIFWIGHLYFLNFTYRQFELISDPATVKQVQSGILPRLLWWFRWSAMMAFLLGFVLFFLLYTYPTTGNLLDEGGLTGRGTWMLLGITLGTFLWLDAWFVIWPAQKKILDAISNHAPPNPAVLKRVQFTLKVNAYMSGPTLFAMLAANHYGAVSWLTVLVTFLFALLVFRIFYGIASKI